MLSLIEAFGENIIVCVKTVFRYFFLIVFFPFILLYKCFRFLALRLKSFAVGSYRRVVGDQRFFTGRLVRAIKNLSRTAVKHPKSVPSILLHYIKKGFSQYRKLGRYLALLSVPVLAAVFLFFTLRHYASLSLALKLTVGDETLGYVSSENDYLLARSEAAGLLSFGAGVGEDVSGSLPEVTLTSELITINKFTSSDVLVQRLIGASSIKTVYACGVYIDGEFLCAVKNESDAKRVFTEILKENSPENQEGIISFVEEISYVQGLYPENSAFIWDSQALSDLLHSARENDVFYTVEEEETLPDVAEKNGISLMKIYELNPRLEGLEEVPAGTRVLVFKAKDFMTVKTVKTEVSNVVTDYETVEIQSDTMYMGTSRTVVSGQTGYDQLTKLVTYVDGKKVDEEEVDRITVKEPVAERVQVGVRALDSQYVRLPSYGGILLWPAVNADRINSDYEWRWGKLHSAIDIGSSSGTSLGKTVIAAAEGTVVIAGVHSSYGYYVRINHGNGMETLYAHCMAGSLMVNVGDHVYAGQPIARVGQTGFATGPHLHFEVIINGSRVDPKPYLGISR